MLTENTVRQIGATRITAPTDDQIEITRSVAGSRSAVFEAWTNPELLSQWMLGPRGWTMPVCEIDLRPAGTWHFVWRRGDGEELAVSGRYCEVNAPWRLVTTESWGPDSIETINTVVLSEINGRTSIKLTIRYPWKEARDAAARSGMLGGISSSFDRLAELLGTIQ
jgi:uncharacterized protein YndB with AHSA1/START domain